MAETTQSRLKRLFINFFPCYRASGARVIYIAGDFKEVRVKLPLHWGTRNYVGTLFGGSIYSAVDPVYMLMLIHLLGKDYIVWDKAATIRFLKPGKSTLFASFVLTDDELAEVRALAEQAPSVDRVYQVELRDGDGNVCATVEKTLYIKKKAQKG